MKLHTQNMMANLRFHTDRSCCHHKNKCLGSKLALKRRSSRICEWADCRPGPVYCIAQRLEDQMD